MIGMQVVRSARGFSLLELLLVMATGTVIAGSLLQVYVHGHQVRLVQLELQRTLDTATVVRQIVRDDVEMALKAATILTSAGVAGLVPVERWSPGASFSRPSTAVGGSDVFVVRQYSVDASEQISVSSNLYYLAHRGGRREQPAGLYRRRSRPDGGFYRGEELVTGLRELAVEVCQRRCYRESLVRQHELTAVRIHYVLEAHSDKVVGVLTIPASDNDGEGAVASGAAP